VNLCWVLARIATVLVHFTTTRSELLAAHWLADRFPETIPTPVPWCRIGQMSPVNPLQPSSLPRLAIVH
jgi:hypothetical protein